jgi:hypothetical protein
MNVGQTLFARAALLDISSMNAPAVTVFAGIANLTALGALDLSSVSFVDVATTSLVSMSADLAIQLAIVVIDSEFAALAEEDTF